MRVISGSAKGHKLKCITGINTRPTQDRVKESLFNIIMNYIPDSLVLDLYSGTGNLAIEALSRGAKYAIMVDKSPQCVEIINQNVFHTKLQDKCKIIKGEVLPVIRKLDQKFNLIFMDPPYSKGNIIPTLNLINECNILCNDGLIVIEREQSDLIIEDNPFKIIREVNYGNTIISFLKKDLPN